VLRCFSALPVSCCFGITGCGWPQPKASASTSRRSFRECVVKKLIASKTSVLEGIRRWQSLIAAFLPFLRRFLLNLLIDGAAFLTGTTGLVFRLILVLAGVLIGLVLVRHDGLP